MFFNLRYLTLLVYGIIIILCLLAGVYFRYYTTENLIRVSNQKQAQEIAHTYINTIWNRYYPVIGYLQDKPITQAKSFSQYLSFADESTTFFSSEKIVKAVIHNSHGVMYESNDKILKEHQGVFHSLFNSKRIDKALEQALYSKTALSLVMQTTIGDKNETSGIIKVLVPIFPTKVLPELKNLATNANAVLEINYDVSSELRVIKIIQFACIFIIVCGFGVITAGIFISAQTAEKALDKQQESAAEMAAAKASAEAESKEKSKFLANVSHELRTPLNAIIGFSEIISTETMGPLNNDQYKEFIKDIHTSGLHLLSLINDILDFSKAEEDKLEVIFEDIDITKVIKTSLKMVSPRAEQSKVTLIDELPAEHIILRADGKRIKQVLLNLLSNSVKFTPEGGKCNIKAWKNLDMHTIVIEVADTGVGMEPQDLAKALAPFGQVDNKLSRRYEGTGLGLPLTKKLTELMKGKFDIKSEVGLGTTITLTFPLPISATEEGTSNI